jgi:hypothetical protein
VYGKESGWRGKLDASLRHLRGDDKLPKRQVRFRDLKRYTGSAFRPYVTALGQFALAWNDLQESLGALFWTLRSPRPVAGAFIYHESLFVWNGVKSDRTQREMLRAAVNHLITDWERPELVNDVNWLLDKADCLANWRNDAIHSPLIIFTKGLGAVGERDVRPASYQFNPRAISLTERADLLAEFRFCRDYAITLADYAHLIDLALINLPIERPWPSRPQLPTRKASKVSKSAR